MSTDVSTEGSRQSFSRQSFSRQSFSRQTSESMLKSPQEKHKWSLETGARVSAGQCFLCTLMLLHLTCAGSDATSSVEALHNRGLLWLCHELTKDISVPTGLGCAVDRVWSTFTSVHKHSQYEL